MSRFDAVGRIGICLLVGGILVSGVVMETTPRVRESQIVSIIFLPPAIPGQRMLPEIYIYNNSILNLEYFNYSPVIFTFYSEEFINKPSISD